MTLQSLLLQLMLLLLMLIACCFEKGMGLPNRLGCSKSGHAELHVSPDEASGSIAVSSPFTGSRHCSWTLRAPFAFSVAVNILKLSLRPCCDVLNLFNGALGRSRIATLTGSLANLSSTKFWSAQNSLTVEFITNASRPATASFELEFSTLKGRTYVCSDGFHSAHVSLEDGMNALESRQCRNTPYTFKLNCIFTLAAPNQRFIRARLLSLDTYHVDSLRLFDGDSTSAPELGSVASENSDSYETPWISAEGALTVLFSLSPMSQSCYGFKMQFAAASQFIEDGDIEVNPDSLSSTLTNFKNRYGYYESNQDHLATIRAPPGYIVAAYITHVALEACCDYLALFDGPNTDVLLCLLGSTQLQSNVHRPQVFKSTGSTMTVEFHSDFSVERSGFIMKFYAETAVVSVCSDGGANFTLPAGSWTDSLASSTGFRLEPSQYYEQGSTCIWNLTAPIGFVVAFSFTFLSLPCEPYLAAFDGTTGVKLAGCSDRMIYSGKGALTKNARYYSESNKASIIAIVPARRSMSFRLIYRAVPDGSMCMGDKQIYIFYEQLAGTLVSHKDIDNRVSYNGSMNCSWTLRAPEHFSLSLTVLDLDLEPGFDFLLIYSETDQLMANLSSARPEQHSLSQTEFTATGSSMTVRFVSDARLAGSGFHLAYRAIGSECGHAPGPIAVTGVGQLGSHAGFSQGKPYENRLNCSWQLQARDGYTLFLWFSHLDLEACCDRVSLHSNSGELLTTISGRIGGADSPAYSSGGSEIWVRFETNGSKTRTGFRINYAVSLHRNRSACSGSQQLFVRPDSEPVSIVSHEHFGNGSVYASGLSCDWTLRAPVGHEIVLWFTHVDVEPGVDSVSVFDGSTLLQVASQLDQPVSLPAIVAVSGTARVLFTANSSETRTGFELRFMARPRVRTWACSGDAVVQADFDLAGLALVSHSGFGFGSLYSGNASCSWTIVAPADSSGISAWFTHMDLEACCDRVSLFDGADSPLASLSLSVGEFNSSVYRSASRLMTVRFETGGTGRGRTGFRLRVATTLRDGAEYLLKVASLTDPSTSTVAFSVQCVSAAECSALCASAGPAACLSWRFSAQATACLLSRGG